jgi:anaerobic C4-dicarboxylate transporter
LCGLSGNERRGSVIYEAAIQAGKIAAILVIGASTYYWLRFLVIRFHIDYIRQRLNVLRQIHPWLGGSILLLYPFHGYVMATTYSSDPVYVKVWLGMALSAILTVQLLLGILLNFNPAIPLFRVLHRYSMFLIIPLLFAHWAAFLG